MSVVELQVFCGTAHLIKSVLHCNFKKLKSVGKSVSPLLFLFGFGLLVVVPVCELQSSPFTRASVK